MMRENEVVCELQRCFSCCTRDALEDAASCSSRFCVSYLLLLLFICWLLLQLLQQLRQFPFSTVSQHLFEEASQ